MSPANHLDKSLAVKRLATDGSNWPLWKATLKSYFESRNIVKHVEGTADRPPAPPTFAKGHILTEEEEANVDKAEERLEKYLSREGQFKTQNILSVSGSLGLKFQKQKTAKDTWDAQVNEMTKKAQDIPNIPAAPAQEYEVL